MIEAIIGILVSIAFGFALGAVIAWLVILMVKLSDLPGGPRW